MSLNENNIISFYQLIDKYEIKIPIIQRDYAQGRDDNQQICLNFLSVIKNAIISEYELNLDFVYGNLVNNIFQPLDGQQRLTTLYLLHWYVYNKEIEEDNSIPEILSKFSYETRLSSRRFCESLIKYRFTLEENTDKVSDLIKDTEWFYISWEQDPTIRAMLNTIDLIHKVFGDIENIWSKLTKQNLIKFHLLILEDFGLSDDLYIKMNARGKLLTPFENLKAEIQSASQKNEWEIDIAETSKLSHKIDTVWTDFLWENFKKDNTIDDSHMNLITTLVMIMVGLEKSVEIKVSERTEIIQRLNYNNSDRSLITYINKAVFSYIYDCYELYASKLEYSNLPQISFELWRHNPNINFLNQILAGNDTSYTHKVFFYAQTQYLLKNLESFDLEKYLDWMRVVRNIVSRGDITIEGKRPDIIRSPDTFSGVVKLVRELSAGCDDIYNYLVNKSIDSGFAKEQVQEEVLKAKIITNYPEHKQLIHNIEDNEILRGKILFVIQCADYVDNIEQIDFQKLSKLSVVFSTYFNKELGFDDKEFNLMRRALLATEYNGQYKFYEYWWSRWSAKQIVKRKLFAQFREVEYFIEQQNYNPYFKNLVLLLCEKNYHQIIEECQKNDHLPNWQYRLIKESNLLDEVCKSKFIAISDDNTHCFLLKSKRTKDVEGSPQIE